MQPTMAFLSRKLRNCPTETEKLLWRHLRNKQFHGLKLRRQYPIGRAICDFVCLDKKLIIELDGGQHAENTTDLERTRILESNGFLVLRFWNNDVMSNIDGVLSEIEHTLRIGTHHGP